MTDDEKRIYEAKENSKSIAWAIIKGQIKVSANRFNKLNVLLFMLAFIIFNFKEIFRPSLSMFHKMSLVFFWLMLFKQALGAYMISIKEIKEIEGRGSDDFYKKGIYCSIKRLGIIGVTILVFLFLFSVILYLNS